MANHNGSRRVNGVRCTPHAPPSRRGEELEPLLTLTYTYFGRTNERTVLSFDLEGSWQRFRNAGCAVPQAFAIRSKFNYKTIFEAGPDPRGQISTVWPACAQGHGSHCQAILQPRERRSSRRKCSYPASRMGW